MNMPMLMFSLFASHEIAPFFYHRILLGAFKWVGFSCAVDSLGAFFLYIPGCFGLSRTSYAAARASHNFNKVEMLSSLDSIDKRRGICEP